MCLHGVFPFGQNLSVSRAIFVNEALEGKVSKHKRTGFRYICFLLPLNIELLLVMAMQGACFHASFFVREEGQNSNPFLSLPIIHDRSRQTVIFRFLFPLSVWFGVAQDEVNERTNNRSEENWIVEIM